MIVVALEPWLTVELPLEELPGLPLGGLPLGLPGVVVSVVSVVLSSSSVRYFEVSAEVEHDVMSDIARNATNSNLNIFFMSSLHIYLLMTLL